MGFLSPYRVLDLTDERGLLAGKVFADLGADVIQIEPVGGSHARHIGPFRKDGPQNEHSLCWEAYACNKRGITCDLNSKEGQELFRRLCASADFLFESEKPGIMERRGLSYEALQEINPGLIYVTITPFVSAGPKAEYADSEIIVWAAGTALYANRDGERPPLRVSVLQAYLHAAADAAGGALVAHFARLQYGLGQHIEVSAQESVGQATLSGILGAAVGDLSYERGAQGIRHAKVIDQSGSGSALRRSKWSVQDGYVEMHLPSLQFPLSVYRLVVEAGANRDFNSIHHNTQYAQKTGAPEMYANTIFLQGMWERTVREFIGLGGVMKSLKGFRMKIFNTVGETVVTKGVVKRKWQDAGEALVELEIWSENSRGISVGPGTVVVALPRRGDE